MSSHFADCLSHGWIRQEMRPQEMGQTQSGRRNRADAIGHPLPASIPIPVPQAAPFGSFGDISSRENEKLLLFNEERHQGIQKWRLPNENRNPASISPTLEAEFAWTPRRCREITGPLAIVFAIIGAPQLLSRGLGAIAKTSDLAAVRRFVSGFRAPGRWGRQGCHGQFRFRGDGRKSKLSPPEWDT